MAVLVITGGLAIGAAVYKRLSDDLAWGVCRVAAWRDFDGGPIPLRPDSLSISGWGVWRDISAVYRLEEGRRTVGCTMAWDREMGWFPHELVTFPAPAGSAQHGR